MQNNNETERLTPKQEAFCVHYTTIGAETFSNGTKAAIAAGYSKNSAYSQASTLLKNPKIQQRIKQLHSENMSRNMVTVDSVLSELDHIEKLAIRDGQFGAATRCVELKGRYLAMFTDRLSVDVDDIRVYTEAERLEAKRIALVLVTGDCARAKQLPVIDVEANQTTGTSEPGDASRCERQGRDVFLLL